MKKPLFYKCVILIQLFFIFCLIIPINGFADNSATNEQSIAIIPFEIISQEDITYIQSGILQMLYSRLVWKDHVNLIKKDIILKHLGAVKTNNNNKIIKEIAALTNADYVLSGSITNFSNAFSIDTKIYDIRNQQYLTFSEQSEVIDDVIPKLKIISARINQKVFKRETIDWEELAKKEKEKTLQWQRQNPEKLMPSIPKGLQEEKTPIWKFWQFL